MERKGGGEKVGVFVPEKKLRGTEEKKAKPWVEKGKKRFWVGGAE